MQKIEPKPLTLRTRLKRLAHKTLCFSRSRVMHDLLLGLYRSPKSFVEAAVHASTLPCRLRLARTDPKTARPERSAAKSKGVRQAFSPHFIEKSHSHDSAGR